MEAELAQVWLETGLVLLPDWLAVVASAVADWLRQLRGRHAQRLTAARLRLTAALEPAATTAAAVQGGERPAKEKKRKKRSEG